MMTCGSTLRMSSKTSPGEIRVDAALPVAVEGEVEPEVLGSEARGDAVLPVATGDEARGSSVPAMC